MVEWRYRNPWHKPGRPEYGPEEYSSWSQPRTYKGYQIFNQAARFDVVLDGECKTQMAGARGATDWIDKRTATTEK